MTLDVKCPTCGMIPENLKSADHILEKPVFGSLYVCGGCASTCKFTLLGLELLSPDEENALDEDTKKDLSFAKRAIVRHLRQS